MNDPIVEPPHITVATIVEKNGLFLMVEEGVDGELVYNQPAGHLEADETLVEAAVRETLEETGWDVEIQHFLGIYQSTSALHGIHYVRHCFIAEPLRLRPNFDLDPDINRALWLNMEQINELEPNLRSPAVLSGLRDYLIGTRYPLSLLNPTDSFLANE